VPEWARAQVAYAAANGITSGISATLFGADDPMTANQYITFVLRAMGYTDRGNNPDFVWNRAAEFAYSIGMITEPQRDMYMRSNLFLRDQMAVISNNAIYWTELKGGGRIFDTLVWQGRPAGRMPVATLRDIPPAWIFGDNYAEILGVIKINVDIYRSWGGGTVPIVAGRNGDATRFYQVYSSPQIDYVEVRWPDTNRIMPTVYIPGNIPEYTLNSHGDDVSEALVYYYTAAVLASHGLEEFRAAVRNPAVTQEMLDEIKEHLDESLNSELAFRRFSAVIFSKNSAGENTGRYILLDVSRHDTGTYIPLNFGFSSLTGQATFQVYNINPDCAGFGMFMGDFSLRDF
jgi:hypothetical protein